MSDETITPRQELFNYLSKELGTTALETDLIAIERIARLGLEMENERLYQNMDSMKQTNLALANKAVEFQGKYEKCISVIKRFDAGIIGMYDL